MDLVVKLAQKQASGDSKASLAAQIIAAEKGKPGNGLCKELELKRSQRFEQLTKDNPFTKRKLEKERTAKEKKAEREGEKSAANVLNKMTGRKKPESVALQTEVASEAQWKNLMKNEGLIVVDVYCSWAGPNLSMVNLLKKVKGEINDDGRLWLATANSDCIEDLKVFQNRSEPIWGFFGGGKPVRLLRGSNGPQLYETIKEEYAKEIICLEGKTRRKLISLKDEVIRREKAENEAIKIVKHVNKEIAKSVGTSKENTPAVEEALKTPQEEEDEELQNNTSLKDLLRPFTILMIQDYLLDTGCVTEIRDKISPNFRIVRERFIELSEEMIRKIFEIPYEIHDPNEPDPELEQLEPEDEEKLDEEKPEEVLEPLPEIKDPSPSPRVSSRQSRSKSKSKEPTPPKEIPQKEASPRPEVKRDSPEKEKTPVDGEEDHSGGPSREKSPQIIQRKMIPVPLPEELQGETLLMLLESKSIRKAIQDKEMVFNTADDLVQDMIGPNEYSEGEEEPRKSPNPKHILSGYGKSEFICGISVTQNFQDKQFVFFNYYPQFITQLLIPPPIEEPKYCIAVYSVDILSNLEFSEKLNQLKKFILAEGKLRIPADTLYDMLKSWKFHRDDHKRKEMSKYRAYSLWHHINVYAVCFDERVEENFFLFKSFHPYHISFDSEFGRLESKLLFHKLDIQIDNFQPKNEDYFYQNFSEIIYEKSLSDEEVKGNDSDDEGPISFGSEDESD